MSDLTHCCENIVLSSLFIYIFQDAWINIIQENQNLSYYLLIIFPSAEALK